ncbi:Uncharacterised protein family UPF0114 [Prunus dulcis]|uniref:Uncharacterized protein n=1 Tax=Prunus dulcis TaxID=3755 RepID=A0A4Y1RFG1_PRUDU|nr:Uncharacterised protein family UPF0114 [Prunus dulcis]
MAFRFMAFLGVLGSLIGSFLCFIKGCTYVVRSFMEYSVNRSKVIWSLVEAIDVYLLGTVMLVFGMGLYELFISNLDIVKSSQENKPTDRSNLLGMFTLKERPKWLDITTVNELKTKLGHVIVMLLLIGLFEKSGSGNLYPNEDGMENSKFEDCGYEGEYKGKMLNGDGDGNGILTPNSTIAIPTRFKLK